MNKLSLIGFRGSGKTTLGKLLAKKMRMDFIDLDKEIERQHRMSISQIFSLHDEEYFRAIESTSLNLLLESSSEMIVSTGGGVILDPKNRKRLKDKTFVLFLNTPEQILIDRLVSLEKSGDTTRPPLSSLELEDEIHQLLQFRLPLYQLTAHLEVSLRNALISDNLNTITKVLIESGPKWVQSRLNDN